VAQRDEIELKFQVKNRTVTVKAMETIGAEDAYQVLFGAVLHRYVTNEDVVPAISREVKDWLIKVNLSI
jgi:hypothetical protein